MKAKLIVCLVYFVILYIVAYINHRGYEDDEDVLGISKNQWFALLELWIPILLIFRR